jgi:hypothetical protein
MENTKEGIMLFTKDVMFATTELVFYVTTQWMYKSVMIITQE